MNDATKPTVYPPAEASPNFPKLEEAVGKWWEENAVFQRSIDQRREQGADEFVFYDGPPFANGLPHYGHIVTSFVKDLVPRYQTMRGKHGRSGASAGTATGCRRNSIRRRS